MMPRACMVAAMAPGGSNEGAAVRRGSGRGRFPGAGVEELVRASLVGFE